MIIISINICNNHSSLLISINSVGIKISRKPISKPFFYIGIFSLILAIASIIILAKVPSWYPAVFPVFIIILLITCPLSLIFLFISFRKGRSPPDILTKIEFIKSQYKSFRLKDASKAYVCMVCKRDLEINQDVHNCPNCQTYYHEEHLFQWLQVNTSCPVCGFDYYQNALKSRKSKK